MKSNKWLLLPAAVVFLLPAMQAKAIEVFPIVKEIRTETPRENFILVKSGHQLAENEELSAVDRERYEFVTLELFHVTNPGETNEARIKEYRKGGPAAYFFSQ